MGIEIGGLDHVVLRVRDLGAALGPGLAGTALEWGGNDLFGAFVIVCATVAAILLAAFARTSAATRAADA